MPLRWAFPIACFLLAASFSHMLSTVRPGETADAGGRRADAFEWIGRHNAFSFGFRNLLADLAWLQAVQVAGARQMTHADFDRLSRWVNVVADLDERFVVPYLLGGLVLSESTPHAGAALKILSRGMGQFPSDWRFPFYAGYIRYFVLNDPAGGGEEMARSSRLPGAPVYLPRLAARMLAEGRAPDTALDLLSQMIAGETDPGRRGALERRYAEVLVERDIQRLEDAVSAYRARYGEIPGTPADLVRAGILASLPVDPGGGSYRIAPDGSVHHPRRQERLKVKRR